MIHVIRARWLVPAGGECIADGAVVAEAGRILRVGPWRDIARLAGPDDHVEHLPDSALLPGLVNAHTHLSLSDMRGKFRPTKNFGGWIARLAARRLLRTEAAMRRAVADGAAESAAAGTVAGADLTYDAAFDECLSRDPARWTVFVEVMRFGRAGEERLAEALAAAERLEQICRVPLAACQPVPSEQNTGGQAASGTPTDRGHLRVGLSPHAPYTVAPEMFARIRREADRRGWPLSTHLHETEDEIAFTERGEGTLHGWLSAARFLPRDWRPAGLRPIPMLAAAGFFSGPVLVGHANYVTDEDIAILARSGSSVAFCPRSHAFFKHRDHPWRRLLAAGVNVCLGTDSLASSPSLSVLDEARFLFAQSPDADPRVILDMATRRGAMALGLGDEVGDLAPGLVAEFCAVDVPADVTDPRRAILAGTGAVRAAQTSAPYHVI
jgi:aminodeoxyfutalosine deaminase